MTAEHAGKGASDGVWATLKKLKERWVLVVFVTGALFWVRDTWEEFSRLPAGVAGQAAELGRLAARVGALESGSGAGGETRRASATGSPGDDRGKTRPEGRAVLYLVRDCTGRERFLPAPVLPFGALAD